MTISRQIGFISTRFAGTDGVSLESAKWACILERLGHNIFYFCGESDRPPEVCHVVPEAFYHHPIIDALNAEVFTGVWNHVYKDREVHPEIGELYKDFFNVYTRPAKVTRQIQKLKEHFKENLYQFAYKFRLEALIIENALTIPVNIPLGLAITEFIAETGFPTIAHHHDFSWERQRFINNAAHDYLDAAFPPTLPSIHHVVLNSIQAQQLAWRKGLASEIIPNVMDFDQPPAPPNGYAENVRAELGVEPGQYFILQPTRIIQRKGIEHAIELTRRLDLPARLVISHSSGDEGSEYEKRVHEFAALLGVAVNFECAAVGEARGTTSEGNKIYALADIYPYADLVTYPSAIEGFGNAFLEAVYYKRPLVVNNYSIYEADIRPKGFKVIEFDGFISESTLQQAREALLHPEKFDEQCENNYAIAKRYYSFSMLERKLSHLLAECFGDQV